MAATVFYNASDELALCSNTFVNAAGTPTDPTTATLVITNPLGAVTTYNWPGGPNTLTHGTAGQLSQNVPCASAIDGNQIWQGVWDGTGTASDAQAFTWTVFSTKLNQYYCSLEELKSRLRISGTSDDFELLMAIAAASRAVDGYCDRYFYRGTDTRTYIPGDLYNVCTDDFVSVTTLATDPSGSTAIGGNFPVTWAGTDYQPWPYNPGNLGEPWPYTKIRAIGTKVFPWVVPQLLMRQDRVQLTAVYGWPAVPQAIRTATLATASELFRMKDQPGGQVPGDFATAIIRGNPITAQLLGVYRRHPFLAA